MDKWTEVCIKQFYKYGLKNIVFDKLFHQIFIVFNELQNKRLDDT